MLDSSSTNKVYCMSCVDSIADNPKLLPVCHKTKIDFIFYIDIGNKHICMHLMVRVQVFELTQHTEYMVHITLSKYSEATRFNQFNN